MRLIAEAVAAFATFESNRASRTSLRAADDLPYPGLPVTTPPPSASYWIAHNRANELNDHSSRIQLPSEADVVIIGAGISGASIAHFLMASDNPPHSLVMLEAREVSSGATGRNGGFIKPVAFGTYSEYKKFLGVEQALHVIQSEYDTLDLSAHLVKSLGIDAGFKIRPHQTILLDKETADRERSQLAEIRSDRGALNLPQIDDVVWYDNVTEARSVTRSKTALEGYTTPSGSMWPHKFVHGLISRLLKAKHLELFTHTPVTRIERSADRSHWLAYTAKGSIKTPKMILATNGYTSTLLPDTFTSKIIPKRTQMAAYTVPLSYGAPMDWTFNIRGRDSPQKGNQSLANLRPDSPTLLFNDEEEAYGLTTSDGTFVVGSALAMRATESELQKNGSAASSSHADPWVGSADDSQVFEPTTQYFEGIPKHNFAGWEAEGVGEGLFRTWTGIQGLTLDTLPFVGALPDGRYDGLYISAGFHGHGMARCLVASRGLVHQLQSSTGREWDERLPRAFQITPLRLNRTIEEMRQYLEDRTESRTSFDTTEAQAVLGH